MLDALNVLVTGIKRHKRGEDGEIQERCLTQEFYNEIRETLVKDPDRPIVFTLELENYVNEELTPNNRFVDVYIIDEEESLEGGFLFKCYLHVSTLTGPAYFYQDKSFWFYGHIGLAPDYVSEHVVSVWKKDTGPAE